MAYTNPAREAQQATSLRRRCPGSREVIVGEKSGFGRRGFPCRLGLVGFFVGVGLLKQGQDLSHLLATLLALEARDKAKLGAVDGLSGSPGRRECLLARRQGFPSRDVVDVPEVELQVFGLVLNVDEVVHVRKKASQCSASAVRALF